MDLDELTAIFASLGAPDPKSWASSQLNEDINQLGRFLFLKGAWGLVVEDDDPSWISNLVEGVPPGRDRPFDGVAHALRRILATGADEGDIGQLVRGQQAALLFGVLYLLSDASVVEGNSHQSWQLFEVDDSGQPLRPIGGLHESLLGTDPTGREMRPRFEY